MEICFAREEELNRINTIRKQVNDLHVAGKTEVFKPGFSEKLRDYIYEVFRDPRKKIIVCKNGMRVRRIEPYRKAGNALYVRA